MKTLLKLATTLSFCTLVTLSSFGRIVADEVDSNDGDGDGIVGEADFCSGTPPYYKAKVDGHGCAKIDSDNDSVIDAYDLCAKSIRGESVFPYNGCQDHFYWASVEYLGPDGVGTGQTEFMQGNTAGEATNAVLDRVKDLVDFRFGSPTVKREDVPADPQPLCEYSYACAARETKNAPLGIAGANGGFEFPTPDYRTRPDGTIDVITKPAIDPTIVAGASLTGAVDYSSTLSADGLNTQGTDPSAAMIYRSLQYFKTLKDLDPTDPSVMTNPSNIPAFEALRGSAYKGIVVQDGLYAAQETAKAYNYVYLSAVMMDEASYLLKETITDDADGQVLSYRNLYEASFGKSISTGEDLSPELRAAAFNALATSDIGISTFYSGDKTKAAQDLAKALKDIVQPKDADEVAFDLAVKAIAP